MRSLAAFLWCALFLLQSVRAEGDPPACNPPWRIPVDVKSCTQIIKWKVHSVEQATATCQEYFPTTFVDGVTDVSKPNEIKCIVYSQFQCNFLANSFPIFDKCYHFEKTNEVTLEKYLANPTGYCDAGGNLPVFLTMTQAKHIAKRANMRGIAKMWVNLDRDGRLIEKVNADLGAGFMLHKDLWKLHKDNWWDGDILQKSTPSADGPVAPPQADSLFFRTDTDYVRNLWQGQFELATKKAEATIVCEYPAKIVPEQKRYCDKMGENGLGLNAIYDDRNGRERCLYTTLTNYPMKGTVEAIENFPGCKERPSKEHVTGLDDGTAFNKSYDFLTKSGTYRVAGIKVDLAEVARKGQEWPGSVRRYCLTGNSYHRPTGNERQPYRIFDHFMNSKFAGFMSSLWDADYPKNECSDFPKGGEMESNTLAIRNTRTIDVPVPVHFKAICSIETNVDCELNPGTCRADQECRNVKKWNDVTNKYAECHCVKFHKEEIVSGTQKVCNWDPLYWDNTICGKVRDHEETDWKPVPNSPVNRGISVDHPQSSFRTVEAIVRKGCTMTIWTHGRGSFALLDKVPMGQYNVPNMLSGTFNGNSVTMDPATADCTCP